AAECSGQMQGKVLTAAAKEKTHWYKSHPSHRERQQRALQASQPGVIVDSRPATVLFNKFGELSRGLTLASYRIASRGKPVSPDQIFSVSAPAAETTPDTSSEEAAIKAYFGGLGFFLKPV